MSEDQAPIDPYEVVLKDLRAKRAEIDQAIAAIERIRSGGSGTSASTRSDTPNQAGGNGEIRPDMFFGMTIPEAAKALLGHRKRQLSNGEIAADLKAGGMVLQSADAANTIGSVLTRRFQQVGDIVKVGRGTWGLREWSPHIRYRPKEQEDGSEPKEE